MDTFYNGNKNYNNIYLEPLKYYLRGFNSSFFAEKVNNLSKFVNKEFSFSDAFRFSVGINNYCNVSGLKDKELKKRFYDSYLIFEANKDCLDRYTILGELNLHPIIGNHYPDKNGLLGSSFRPDRLKRDFTKYEDTRHSSGLVWPGLIGELCHLSPKNSTIALSNIEEISWSHLFSIDPYLPTTERCDEKYLYFPDGFRHPLWDESMPSFILTSYRNIYDTSGKIL